MSNENFVFEIADEIEQLATILDEILDKLDFLKIGKEEDARDVSERICVAIFQVKRALSILNQVEEEQ